MPDSDRPSGEILACLRAELRAAPLRQSAWLRLLHLAGEPPQRDSFLVEQLVRTLRAVPAPQRLDCIEQLAPLLLTAPRSLVLALATSKSTSAHRLALAVLPHLPSPHNHRIRLALRQLVCDKRIPIAERLNALAMALARLGDGSEADKLLRTYLRRFGKTRTLHELDRLLEQAGSQPQLTGLIQKIESLLRLSCPRCGVELRQPAMLSHLWQQHRLVLEGRRVRDPWSVVEDWLKLARQPGQEIWIERCRIAADKLDPQGGRIRLNRLLLAHQLGGDKELREILAEADRQHAGCCPRCYALVRLPGSASVPAILLRAEGLVAGEYVVLLNESGLRPVLEVRKSSEVIYRGVEPGETWTPGGARQLWAGTLVGLALLCAIFWPSKPVPPYVPVIFLLFLACLAWLAGRIAESGGEPARLRVLAHAWQWLVPRLHAQGFSLADSSFLTALCGLSLRLNWREAPLELLNNQLRLTEQAVENHQAPPLHLALLLRLRAEIAAEQGEDPVPLLVRKLARCFRGKLPLAFAQDLLEDWVADFWTQTSLARLRVLLCDRAFEAGFEVQNLLDASQQAPALGSTLRIESVRRLAALRLLWSMRAERPWKRLGEVRTVFELAEDPQLATPLARYPDLLLWYQDSSRQVVADRASDPMGPLTIQQTLAGVWLQDILFISMPRVIEVRHKSMSSELFLGADVFRSSENLEPVARLLERWFRWTFQEFAPQVDSVLTWQSPDRAAILRSWGAIACPECGRYFLPRVGELGTVLEERPR
jgi:hypothetical protein